MKKKKKKKKKEVGAYSLQYHIFFCDKVQTFMLSYSTWKYKAWFPAQALTPHTLFRKYIKVIPVILWQTHRIAQCPTSRVTGLRSAGIWSSWWPTCPFPSRAAVHPALWNAIYNIYYYLHKLYHYHMIWLIILCTQQWEIQKKTRLYQEAVYTITLIRDIDWSMVLYPKAMRNKKTRLYLAEAVHTITLIRGIGLRSIILTIPFICLTTLCTQLSACFPQQWNTIGFLWPKPLK